MQAPRQSDEISWLVYCLGTGKEVPGELETTRKARRPERLVEAGLLVVATVVGFKPTGL